MSTDWSTQYKTLLNDTPKPGSILRAYNREPVRLIVDLQEGKSPFVYGLAYVPSIVGHELGWFLHAVGSDASFGHRCILLPKAREDALKKCTVADGVIAVESLRVIRLSDSKKSLLCEVHKYLDAA